MKIEKETFFCRCQAEANKPGFDTNKMNLIIRLPVLDLETINTKQHPLNSKKRP